MPCPFARALSLVAATIPLLLFPSCGSGVAAVFGGSSGSATPDADDFAVVNADFAPARISFRLVGADSDVVLRFLVDPDGAGPLPLETGEIAALGTVEDGDSVAFAWDFDSATFPLFSNTMLTRDTTIAAVTPAGFPLGSVTVDIGNTAPTIDSVEVLGTGAELSGIIPITFTVSDESSDRVILDVDFDAGDGFQPATSAGTLSDLDTSPGGETYTYSWNSVAAADLAGEQASGVVLRVRVRETFGHPLMAERSIDDPVTVDNNAAPIAALTNGAFITNDDERRGIPIPFVVTDAESDPTRTVFQWRREGEAFPALATTVAEFLELDAADRLAMQIATEMPLAFGGRLVPVAAAPGTSTRVRLPELADSQAGLLGRGLLGGAQLDVLRTDRIPGLVPWDGLTAPVGAVPRGDGSRAIVLDRTSMNSWSLLDVALASGESDLIASGGGLPTALALDPGDEFAFVATTDSASNQWSVRRVQLADPPIVDPPIFGALEAPDGIRGMLAPSGRVALVTVDDRIVRVDFAVEAFTVLLDFDGDAEPSGIAQDALRPDRVFVADRANDRIFELDLNTTTLEEVSAVVAIEDQILLGTDALPSPQALAVEPASNTLIVLTRPLGSVFSLRAVPLRTAVDRDGVPGADAVVYELGRMPGLVSSIATGPDNLRLLAIPVVGTTGSGNLAIGGGLQQSRLLVDDPDTAYDRLTQVVTVTEPFRPDLEPGLRWRIRDTLAPTVAAPAQPGGGGGTAGVFLWDSRDVPGGGRIHMKLVPMDVGASGDIGTISEGLAVKRVQAGLGPEPPPAVLTLGGMPTDNRGGLVLGDLDGDGDLDGAAAIASADQIVLFQQIAPRVASPMLTLAAGGGPRDVAIGDVNGDGANDLISANNGDHTLRVFYGPTFVSGPTLNGVSGPTSVLVVDLDGDQDADVVATGAGPSGGAINGTVNVFFQGPDGLPPFPTQTLDIPDGDQVFDPCNPANPFPVGARPLAIAAGDLNGDGLVDLATANEAAGTASLFFQNASGDPFTPGPALGTGTFNAFQDVLIADLDVDGDLDLAVANSNPCDPNLVGEVLLFFNQGGSAGFDPQISIGDATMLTGAVSLDSGDIDGDGDLDLVVANLFADTITPLIQVAPGQFEQARGASLGGVGQTNGPRDVVVDDIDGDGNLDLASLNLEAGTAAIFFQTRPGAYTLPPAGVLQPGPVTAPASVAVGDLDGDGDVDLVSANEFSDDLSVFFQENPGVIGPLPSRRLGGMDMEGTATTLAPLSVVVADLDGDGRLDVASANRGGHDVTLFCQDLAGDFPTSPIQLLDALDERRPRALAAADFDGDGLVDLVSANEGSDDLTLFLNDTTTPGNCQFDPAADQTIGPIADGGDATVFMLRPGDVDMDGDVDLLVPHFGRSEVLVYENSGTGTLGATPAQALPSGSSTRGVDLGDLDGDGDLDLAVASAGGPVFLKPDGRFESSPSLTLESRRDLVPRSIAIADLDADGDQDVVVTTLSAPGVAQGSLRLLFQLNRSEFVLFDNGTLTNDGVLRRPQSLVVIDVDGDGDVDIVSANRDADLLSIFYGTH